MKLDLINYNMKMVVRTWRIEIENERKKMKER
jgi:hypothetical protein